jgi:hypothetical protein
MPVHPYDAGYSVALRSAQGADHYWIESRLQEWVVYPTGSLVALERRMGVIDALADLLEGLELPDPAGHG